MINTRSIDIFLRGVRADFALVEDQAQKQLSAYDSNVYLDATNKLGPLFKEINATGKQRAEFTSVTGVPELKPTGEAQPFNEVGYVPSFITSVEPQKFTARTKVTQESFERRDAQYQRALDEVAKHQVAYANTIARHKFDRFNKAFALVTTADVHLFDFNDSVALCASNHPLKPMVPGAPSTYSNIVTASDITSASIEAMVLVLQNQVDDIGEPMPMGGGTKYMVIPPNKVKKAKEAIASEWEVGTANNTVNVWYSSGWVLVTSPFLTSSTAWFILDAMQSPLINVIFKAPTTSTWYDDNIKVAVYDIEAQYKIGATDFRGLCGNAGL